MSKMRLIFGEICFPNFLDHPIFPDRFSNNILRSKLSAYANKGVGSKMPKKSSLIAAALVVVVFLVSSIGFFLADQVIFAEHDIQESNEASSIKIAGLRLIFGIVMSTFTSIGILTVVYFVYLTIEVGLSRAFKRILRVFREALRERKEAPAYALILVWCVTIPLLAVLRSGTFLDPSLILGLLIVLSCLIGIVSIHRSVRVEKTLGTRANFVEGPPNEKEFGRNEISDLFADSSVIVSKATKVRVVSGFPVVDVPGSAINSQLLSKTSREWLENHIQQLESHNNLDLLWKWRDKLELNGATEEKSVWGHLDGFRNSTSKASKYFKLITDRCAQSELTYQRILSCGRRLSLLKNQPDEAIKSILKLYARKAPVYFRHFVDMFLASRSYPQNRNECELLIAPGFRLSTFLLADSHKLIWQLNRGSTLPLFSKIGESGIDQQGEIDTKKLQEGGYISEDMSRYHSINGLFVIENSAKDIITPFEKFFSNSLSDAEAVTLNHIRSIVDNPEYKAKACVDLVIMREKQALLDWFESCKKLMEI